MYRRRCVRSRPGLLFQSLCAADARNWQRCGARWDGRNGWLDRHRRSNDSGRSDRDRRQQLSMSASGRHALLGRQRGVGDFGIVAWLRVDQYLGNWSDHRARRFLRSCGRGRALRFWLRPRYERFVRWCDPRHQSEGVHTKGSRNLDTDGIRLELRPDQCRWLALADPDPGARGRHGCKQAVVRERDRRVGHNQVD